MSFLWELRALREFCDSVGGRYINRGVMHEDAVEVPFQHWAITVDISSRDSYDGVQMVVPYCDTSSRAAIHVSSRNYFPRIPSGRSWSQ